MYDYNKVLEVARAEIGYHEKKSNKDLDDKTANSGDRNYTKYARELDALGFYNGRKNGYAWCDMWIDYIFYKAYGYEAMQKLTNQKPGKSNYGAGCTYSRRYYKQMGRLFDSPKPGDQIFFYQGGDVGNNNSIAHTGIVEKADETYVYTIEGNTSNKVARRKYKLTDSKIAGYGRPNWECDGVPAPVPTPAPAPTPEPEPTPAGFRPATKTAEEKQIWNYLMSKIGNAYGVAGLMGNLKAESALRSCNLQQSYETKLHHTDETYTEAVDMQTYHDFATDKAGYGLAQWTSSGRKKNLLKYAVETNSSIGNLEMQLEFLIHELETSYKTVLATLKTAKDVRVASDAVLLKFEIPANRGVSVQEKRASYGQAYFDKYSGKAPTPASDVILKKGDKGDDVKDLQRMLIEAGYSVGSYGVDGDYGKDTQKAVKKLQQDNGLDATGVYDKATQAVLLTKTGSRVVVVLGGTVNTRINPVDGKVYKVVKRGDRLPYVSTDKATGWYLVYVDGVAVWITPKPEYTKIAQA